MIDERFKYVTAGEIVAAHAVLLRRYGGEGVEAAVRAVENAYYDDVYELAAAYAVYIVQGHVFFDGNKLAASAAMLEFLRLNRARTRITPKRIVSLMVDLQQRSEAGADTGSLISWVASALRGHR